MQFYIAYLATSWPFRYILLQSKSQRQRKDNVFTNMFTVDVVERILFFKVPMK